MGMRYCLHIGLSANIVSTLFFIFVDIFYIIQGQCPQIWAKNNIYTRLALNI